mgnify:CR=1 FL=1
MATKTANGTETTENRDEQVEGVLLDAVTSMVKKLIARGKERGYITIDDFNQALPSEQVSSELIEDTMAMLNEAGINVVEAEDGAEEEVAEKKATEEEEGAEAEDEEAGGNVNEETMGRTDDPVRMYLREMGSVELLSREGEIAIAKRIEAGRNTMIAGLCESPLTFKAITMWREELLDEEILLRDVIDLETTFGRAMDDEGEDEDGRLDDQGQPTTAARAAGLQGRCRRDGGLRAHR